MSKNYTGVDIGSGSLKLAACSGGSIGKMVSVAMPEGLVADGRITSMDAMADFLKVTLRENGGFSKDCTLIMSPQESLVRKLNLPPMSEKELLINLPYEFRDYITQGKDHYVFDYAMLGVEKGEDEAPVSMDLLACAALKQTIEDYEIMFHHAGMRLRAALPMSAALQELVSKACDGREVCFLDFAHSSTTLHFFSKGQLGVIRTIETGGLDVDRAIADTFDVDDFVARGYKTSNFKDCQTCTAAMGVYESIAVEVGRALNFYAFSNPDVTVDTIYYLGGGSLIDSLLENVSRQVDAELRPITELLGSVADEAQGLSCAAAVCSTLGVGK